MKILSLGLDNSILDKTSALAGRVIEYGELVDKYSVIAPNKKLEKVELSLKVSVYGSGGANKIFQLVKIYYLSKNILRSEKHDIITAQDQYYLALIGFILAKKFKIGLEIQLHGFEKLKGLRKLIAKYIMPRANAVRSVSQRLKKQLICQYGVAEEKITVVPIFVESGARSKEPRVVSNNKNDFIFLTVGRLVSVKNIQLQIEAMVKVVKNFPQTELWVIGRGGEENNLKFKIHNLKLNDNIKILGWQNNLEGYYGRADAFLLTSNAEGWGLAVIEAAAHGLPIIMTDVGCAGEVIKNNESGIIIPVGDKARLVEAMIRLINDSALREKLSEMAKLSISRLPSREQTLGLYKKSWQIARDSQ